MTLTRDPEIITTPSGVQVCNLGLASNRRRKRGDNWIDEPIFVDATAFGNTAALIAREYYKGSKIMFHGEWVMKQWEDRATGKNRNKLEISINSIQFTQTRAEQHQPSGSARDKMRSDMSGGQNPPMDIPDDDIPF